MNIYAQSVNDMGENNVEKIIISEQEKEEIR